MITAGMTEKSFPNSVYKRWNITDSQRFWQQKSVSAGNITCPTTDCVWLSHYGPMRAVDCTREGQDQDGRWGGSRRIDRTGSCDCSNAFLLAHSSNALAASRLCPDSWNAVDIGRRPFVVLKGEMGRDLTDTQQKQVVNDEP